MSPDQAASATANGASGTAWVHVCMVSIPDEDSLRGAERFQRDRRSDADRRVAQSGISLDRSSGDNRRRNERRRMTTERFTPADAAAVRGILTNPTSAVSCPACQGNLMLGPPMERGGMVARRVECVDCHRVAMVQAKG